MTNRTKTTCPESLISEAQRYRELTFGYINKKTDGHTNRICLIYEDKREREREREGEKESQYIDGQVDKFI